MKGFLGKVLFVAAAAVTTVISLPYGDNAILRPIAAAVFIVASLMRPGSDDDTILTLATGELLVVAVAEASFPAGFVVQCAVIGAALAGGRAPAGARDIPLFVLYCVAALAGAIVLDRSDRILIPFLAMGAIVVGIAVIAIGLQEMRERRKYAGGSL